MCMNESSSSFVQGRLIRKLENGTESIYTFKVIDYMMYRVQ
jgi:hypothetical protein